MRGGRSRKRNFFRSIKDRLSRSKKRSRSVDPGLPRDDSLSCDENLLRSVSVDRARAGIQLAHQLINSVSFYCRNIYHIVLI